MDCQDPKIAVVQPLAILDWTFSLDNMFRIQAMAIGITSCVKSGSWKLFVCFDGMLS